jgi:hypothetical protein
MVSSVSGLSGAKTDRRNRNETTDQHLRQAASGGRLDAERLLRMFGDRGLLRSQSCKVA